MQILDALDRKILFELDFNSRQSLATLARTLKQSRDRVEYRVQRLVSSGIIRSTMPMVNVYKLGYSVYKTYLRLENKNKRIDELVQFMGKHPRTYWIAFCDGSWGLVVALSASHPKDFQDLHSEMLSRFNKVVLNFSSYVITDLRIYGRKYLMPARRGFTMVGGAPVNTVLDKTDFKIIRTLAKDCRLSAPEIAERTKIQPHVVRYRMEQLENTGVIAGYRLDINLDILGILRIKTQFFLRNYKLDLRKKFIEYCDNHPNIVFYIEQIGDCNVEIELEVESYVQYAAIIDEIRGLFSKLVRNYNTIILREVVRHGALGAIPINTTDVTKKED